MKEKEEHIEQLLVERDLERSEFARMASRVDEVILILSIKSYDCFCAWFVDCIHKVMHITLVLILSIKSYDPVKSAKHILPPPGHI